MDLKKLEEFDKYLDSLYIKKKTDKRKIITLYKKMYVQNKSILDYEKELEKFGWDEITINNISHYILNWNYRSNENRRLNEKCS